MVDKNFEIQVDDQRVRDLLNQLDRKLKDLRPVFEEYGELLVTSIARNFEVGGRYKAAGDWRGGSRKWVPNSVVTIFKNKKGIFKKKSGLLTKKGEKLLAGKKVLIDSEALLNSVNWSANRTGVEVGTNRVYAAIHQFGGKAGRGRKVTIPARPYLVVQPEDINQMAEIVEDHLSGIN